MSDNKPEDVRPHAQFQCAKWLAWCIKNGWSKSRLDDLESLWWEYHDCYGNLKLTDVRI